MIFIFIRFLLLRLLFELGITKFEKKLLSLIIVIN